LLADKGVSVLLTGNCGPNAFQALATAGIQVITGVAGQVREAIRRYQSGTMTGASGPNVQGHFGTGMGMGRGVQMVSPDAPTAGPSPGATDEKEENSALKEEVEALRKQTEDIAKRIRKLEGEG
jgi:signal transduction protein with GAF and PtsI domain